VEENADEIITGIIICMKCKTNFHVKH